MKSSASFWNVNKHHIVEERVNYMKAGKFKGKKNGYYDHLRNDVIFSTKLHSGVKEPATFKQAWYHNDSIKREKWQAAIRKEFNDMTTKKVWKKKDKQELDPGDIETNM